MTTTTTTSLVARRFDDEWRLLVPAAAAVSPFPAVRFNFLLVGVMLAAVVALACVDTDGALRFLRRRSIMPYRTQTRLSGTA